MEKIILPEGKRESAKYKFQIATSAIRFDGEYYDCVVTFEPVRENENTKGMLGLKMIGTNLKAIEMMLLDIASIYPSKLEHVIEVQKCKNVLADVNNKIEV